MTGRYTDLCTFTFTFAVLYWLGELCGSVAPRLYNHTPAFYKGFLGHLEALSSINR